MKYEVDSYILEFNEEMGAYYILFKDSVGKEHNIEINKEIFDTYVKSRKAYIKIKNETTRYIEHSEIYSNNLNKRVAKKEKTVEEIVETKIVQDKIFETIESLPEIQKRRLKKYYFEHKTFEQIANEEKCTKRAIKFSVDIAIQKIFTKK